MIIWFDFTHTHTCTHTHTHTHTHTYTHTHTNTIYLPFLWEKPGSPFFQKFQKLNTTPPLYRKEGEGVGVPAMISSNKTTLQLKFVLKYKNLKSKVGRINLKWIYKWILLNQLKVILDEVFRTLHVRNQPMELYLKVGLLSTA